ncbi:MAG: hypothetical protein GX778_02150 [Erysipelothrix sp.]|nr:hypothetical protein [Erysipelothrix sp.]
MTTNILRIVIGLPLFVLYTILLVVSIIVYYPQMIPTCFWMIYVSIILLTILILIKSRTLKAMTKEDVN